VVSKVVSKTIINSRNRSSDKLDVKGVKINQVQNKNVKNNSLKKNNNAKVNSSVDQANKNLKNKKQELKQMIDMSIEAKSKSKSPDKEK
jgi:hypothetical protein